RLQLQPPAVPAPAAFAVLGQGFIPGEVVTLTCVCGFSTATVPGPLGTLIAVGVVPAGTPAGQYPVLAQGTRTTTPTQELLTVLPPQPTATPARRTTSWQLQAV